MRINSARMYAAVIFVFVTTQNEAAARDVIRADSFSGQPQGTEGIDLIPDAGQTIRAHGVVDMMHNTIINVPTPVDALDAVNKAYVDRLHGDVHQLQVNVEELNDAMALSAALDSRGPIGSRKYRVSVDAANFNGSNAVGVSFVGAVNNDEAAPAFDYGVGAAFTKSDSMLKGSLGVSW